MKAILEFNLPEEQNEYEITQRANDYLCLIWDLQEKLRSNLKYEDTMLNAEQIQEWLYEELNNRKLKIDY
jgi:hypothetical protein